jgi:hypothetical protein
MEYAPLLKPGFYTIPFGDLKMTLTKLLVNPFDGSQRRELLLKHLLTLLKEVSSVCIFTEAWIDGSFVCDKEEPK